jgi:hypothetical protein
VKNLFEKAVEKCGDFGKCNINFSDTNRKSRARNM